MEHFISKAMRLQKPCQLKLSVPPCVFDWLREMADKHMCSETVLARGILEDAFDKFYSDPPEGGDPDEI